MSTAMVIMTHVVNVRSEENTELQLDQFRLQHPLQIACDLYNCQPVPHSDQLMQRGNAISMSK